MPVLSVDSISVSFETRRVLDEISFSVNQGDKIAFIGGNGAGKSTLFTVVKGIVRPDSGRVILHGNTTVGFLSQNMDEQDLSSATLKPRDMTDTEIRLKQIEVELASDHSKEKLDEYHVKNDLIIFPNSGHGLENDPTASELMNQKIKEYFSYL